MKIKKKYKKKQLSRLKRKTSIRKNIHGSNEHPRLSVFKSIQNIYVQAIDDDKGRTIAALNSLSLNMNSHQIKDNRIISFILGKYFGKILKQKGIKKASLDRNGFRFSLRISKLVDGIRKAGIII